MLDWLFGGNDSPDMQTITQSQTLPEWAQNYMRYQGDERLRLYENAKNIYGDNKNYQPYPNARQAGWAEDQVVGFNRTREAADPARSQGRGAVTGGIGMLEGMSTEALQDAQRLRGKSEGFMDEGAGLARQGVDRYGRPIDAERVGTAQGLGGLNAYMNPYRDTVVNNTVREMERSNDRRRLADQGRAAKAGAFGGSRHAILDAERERNFDRALGDTVGAMYDQGFGQATALQQQDRGRLLNSDQFNSSQGLAAQEANRNQFNTEQNRFLSAADTMGNLGRGIGSLSDNAIRQSGQSTNVANSLVSAGNTLQNMDMSAANALTGIGGQQQAFAQQGIDIAYNDFQRQQQHPFAMQGFLQSALQSQPFNPSSMMTTTTNQPAPQGPNPWTQAAGLGIAALGTAGQIGWI